MHNIISYSFSDDFITECHKAVQVNAMHPKFGCALKDIRACTILLTIPLYHIESDGSTEVDQPGLAGTMLLT